MCLHACPADALCSAAGVLVQQRAWQEVAARFPLCQMFWISGSFVSGYLRFRTGPTQTMHVLMSFRQCPRSRNRLLTIQSRQASRDFITFRQIRCMTGRTSVSQTIAKDALAGSSAFIRSKRHSLPAAEIDHRSRYLLVVRPRNK